jgi:hypothetical protein
MKKLHEQKSIINPEVYNSFKQEVNNYPDAKKHQIVSFIKSGIRLIGYALLFIDIPAAAIVLIASEAVGVLEELI